MIINQLIGGHVNALVLAADAGCSLGRVASSAAQFGHVHVLEWLKGRGCVVSEHACTSAAEAGQLEVTNMRNAFLFFSEDYFDKG